MVGYVDVAATAVAAVPTIRKLFLFRVPMYIAGFVWFYHDA